MELKTAAVCMFDSTSGMAIPGVLRIDPAKVVQAVDLAQHLV